MSTLCFFYDIEKTDAISMVAVINDIILRLALDGEKLIGQCYDGCSTMIGKKKGVPTKIKNGNQSFALSTYCYVHPITWHVATGLEIHLSFQNDSTHHTK